MKKRTEWPSLPLETWHETLEMLHLWMQIVGKIKLKQNPFINQWWEVAFFLTARGMTTGLIPYNNEAFEISFDFITHKVIITKSNGDKKALKLPFRTVADFYETLMQTLKTLDIQVAISMLPSEMKNNIPFNKNNSVVLYDKKSVTKWWRILLQSSLILDRFRSDFRGKSSPVQFFWGSFDLNTTRFSGGKLPDKNDWPKGYHFMRYAENEENFAVGFWPGDERFPYPAFYSYMYPAPSGCETIKTGPTFAYFNKKLSECILPYEEVRKAKNPQEEILNFFETTYKEFAKLAGWDIQKLQAIVPKNV